MALSIGLAPPLAAGPRTKLIYPFEIGSARSLPWGGEWSRGRADYSLAALVRDTEALLTPATPMVVRLETLRRAVIYASSDPLIGINLNRIYADRLVTPTAVAP